VLKFQHGASCCRGTVAPLAPANADELHWLRRPVPTLVQRATMLKLIAANTRHCRISTPRKLPSPRETPDTEQNEHGDPRHKGIVPTATKPHANHD
jgi:hypothetical protein